MKEWWINLSLRDKRLASLCGIVLILFLGYEIFFASFNTLNDHLREEITYNQKLLTWMQVANQRMQTLQQLSEKDNLQNPAALLGLLQKSVNTSSFQSHLTVLVQSENNSVQMNFHAVDFDSFMQWLIPLVERNHFVITQMTAMPDGAMGIVDITIYLS